MAEDLAAYLKDAKLRVRYIHSEIGAIERAEILRDLRKKEFDCLVGINLLREGLDLPEVTLVAILDADKEGFLRSETSLIQVAGRAARNIDGQVIMYADTITNSMKRAIDETQRRRKRQIEFNKKYKITPKSIEKAIRSGIEQLEKAKDITLDVVKRLGDLIEKKTDIEVIYTRKTDKFIPLWERTKIANESEGKVFVSIHVNASRNRSASGFETYLLHTSLKFEER